MTTTAGHPPPLAADVQHLAAELARAADLMDGLRAQVHAAGQIQWFSRAATLFKDALLLRERRMRDTAAQLRGASAELQRYADQLAWDEGAPGVGRGPH
ncbi:hypothetical protein IV498_00325 [Paenarthrobacter sp. Z7-10]|uniref:hypothetical protein n=1 Tax=Paenarthrobacter sp. Z7-10 TaxID=2787635 RepID=UPI0022A91441|nr:hypothetical protein [Paenarthrobacter sp. Z7-10]MCZ2401668.1 hypothetical protein [Paenarthrobacter sp. Z7-10]